MHSKRAKYIVEETVRYLKEVRKAKGMSHEALSNLAGVTRAAISHVENGKRRPSLYLALRMAYALDTDLHVLLKRSEQKWDTAANKAR